MFESNDLDSMATKPLFQQNGVPLYLQVATYMRRNIETGVWPVGTRMPSLEMLAENFGVARLTVRQAVQLLVSESLLNSRQGRGTFVSAAPPKVHRTNLQTSWSALITMFEGVDVEIITEADVVHCPGIAGYEPRLAPSYHFMKRVHSRDGMPFCLIDVYMAQEIFQRNPALLLSRPVLTALGQLQVEVGMARQILTIGSADTETAHFLKISPGDPVAHVRRVAEDKQGYTFYMGDVVYRGDCVYQEIDLLV